MNPYSAQNAIRFNKASRDAPDISNNMHGNDTK